MFGKVLNVFDRAINVKTNDDRLLVVSLGQVASPMTINVVPSFGSAECYDAFSNLVQNADDVLVVSKVSPKNAEAAGIAQIMLGGRCGILVIRPVRTFETHILKPDLANLLKFIDSREHLKSVLVECARDRAGSLLNPDATTEGLLSGFTKMIHDHNMVVRSPEFEGRLTRSLLEFCGRGPGFTPAGDDFIAGFLAMLNWIRPPLNLGSPIIPGSEFRKLTLWTSFRLMECNSQGLVDNEVQELINATARGDVLRYADSIRRIALRGHTSGIDFVTGATIAIYLVLDGLRHAV